MRPQSLGVLVLVTAVVGGAAYLVANGRSGGAPSKPDAKPVAGPLFDGLRSKVGQIATINIVTKDGETALQRQPDGTWAIQSKDGFPARLDAVRDLVTDLTAATIVEAKTSEKSYYGRLGVEDPQSKDAKSVAVRLVTDKGDRLAGVIVGNADTGGADPMNFSAGSSRRFVRRIGEDTTYLIEGNVRAERSAIDWADRTVVNIDGQRLKAVTITQPGDESVTIMRGEPDDKAANGALAIQNIPAGRSLKDPGSLDAVMGALAFVRVDDLKKYDPNFKPTGVSAEWRSADGLVVRATLLAAATDAAASGDGAGTWVRYEARYEDAGAGAQANQAAEVKPEEVKPTEPKPEEPKPEPKPESKPGDKKDDAADAGKKKAEQVVAEAKAINDRVGAWMFKVSSWKLDQFTKKMSDLLAPAMPTPSAAPPTPPPTPPPQPPATPPSAPEPMIVPPKGG